MRKGAAALLLSAALFAGAAFPGVGEIPAPAWLPGFPLHAGTSVILMWTPVPGATGYRLLRKSGTSQPVEIYRGAANVFNDAAPPPDVKLVYTVIAVREGKESMPSPGADLKVRTAVRPPVVTGALTSDAGIILRWSSSPGTVFSNVYRSETEQGPYRLLDSIRADTYTDTRVAEGRTYYYRISSVGETSVESARSIPVAAEFRKRPPPPAEEEPVVRMAVAGGDFRGESVRPLHQPFDAGITHGGDIYVLERRGIQYFDANGKFLRRIAFDGKWSLPGGAAIDRDGTFLVTFHAEGVIRRIDAEGKVVKELRYPPYRGPMPPGMRGSAADNVGKSAPLPGAEKEIPVRAPFPNNPNGIAVDEAGNYWIVDGVRSQVVKIDREGREIAVLGRPPGTYPQEKMRYSDLPTAKKISFNPANGKLYVVLGLSAEIKVIDPETADVVRTFGGRGTGNGRFQGIGGMAFRRSGNILVLDALMCVVKEYTPSGKYVATHADIVEEKKVKLSANLATGVAYSETSKRLYLVSTLENRVYMFGIRD